MDAAFCFYPAEDWIWLLRNDHIWDLFWGSVLQIIVHLWTQGRAEGVYYKELALYPEMFSHTEVIIRSVLGLPFYNIPEDTENKVKNGMCVHMHAHT